MNFYLKNFYFLNFSFNFFFLYGLKTLADNHNIYETLENNSKRY